MSPMVSPCQLGPKLLPNGSNLGQSGPKLEPSWAEVGALLAKIDTKSGAHVAAMSDRNREFG